MPKSHADPASAASPNALVLAVARLLLGVFGLLLLAGFAYVGWEVYRRATDSDYRAVMEHGGPIRPVDLTLDTPPDARIEQLLAIGNRLAIRVVSERPRSDRVYIFDPLRGRITTTLALSGDAQPTPADLARSPQ